MSKEFDVWNVEKKKLEDTTKNSLIFHEREIWWCSIGVNLGDEQDGKNELFERPVLIFKKLNNKIAWVLPLSTIQKETSYYHIFNHEGRLQSVILSQLRLISAKRFRRLMGKLSPNQFELIQNKIIKIIKP